MGLMTEELGENCCLFLKYIKKIPQCAAGALKKLELALTILQLFF